MPGTKKKKRYTGLFMHTSMSASNWARPLGWSSTTALRAVIPPGRKGLLTPDPKVASLPGLSARDREREDLSVPVLLLTSSWKPRGSSVMGWWVTSRWRSAGRGGTAMSDDGSRVGNQYRCDYRRYGLRMEDNEATLVAKHGERRQAPWIGRTIE